MRLPVHRWYRYSAGFGAQWAQEVISQEAGNPEALVLDPFAGIGTALIASEQCGIESWGIDSHPFVARVAKAKLSYRSSQVEYLKRAGSVLERAKQRTPSLVLQRRINWRGDSCEEIELSTAPLRSFHDR